MDAPAGARVGALNERPPRQNQNRTTAALVLRAQELQTLRRDGAVCRVDRHGRERFNFRQLVWLYPDVAMQTTPRYSRQVEVLAANLLTLVVPRAERTHRVHIGRTSRAVVALAPDFAKECLLCAPVDGWRIPLDLLEAWLCERSGRQAPLCPVALG